MMNLGQPQLASQIRRLERELDRELLVRSHDGVALTAAGRHVVSALPPLERAMRAFSKQASERFRSTSATLRMAAVMPLGYESNIARLLAFLVASWRRERPGHPLFVSNGSAEDLIAGLKDKRYDIALIDSRAIPAEIEQRAVVRSPLVLVGAPGIIGGGRDIQEILRTTPLALTSRRTGLRQSVDRLLGEILPRSAFDMLSIAEIDSIPVVVNLMLDFGYVSILPASALNASDARLASAPLSPQVDLILSLVWSRTEGARRSAEIVLRTLRDFAPFGPSVSMLDEPAPTDESARSSAAAKKTGSAYA
jgi:DNA-binding transcriptional LysR family regulator